MNKKCVGIIGLGSYVPQRIMTNKDLEERMDTSDQWIVERTGIHERRVAAENESTSDLAAKAGQKALEDAKISPAEIDLIIVATASPDMVFPATACVVQENIKAVNAAAFDISAVCSGFLYAMITGSQFIKAGTYRKVLVIGAETLSRFTDWSDRNTGMLFGDGAGAAVLGETPEGYGILGVDLGADGGGAELLKIPAGGSRHPATMETILQKQHFIYMNGNEVFKFAVKVMGETTLKALKNANLTASDITYLVPHQANIRIIQSAAKRLGIPMEKVVVNINKYGNTSAASIPIALDEAVKSGAIKSGDIVALAGFGGGLTWASSIMKWCK
ncbi:MULTISPECIES: beta-ketoacyl-ACP synthase III [Pelosinus]|jgi:3-oxoacyl-[acyl-carrier-protein] synthase-3|uniref:Beta-ketoacyl-[acyl-carrier-protein] synthase III n=1 Tax=Pelosinus fermentans B4 TaxID=1149862 RepID=I9LJK7_9FIRM|nr:MULTISPECIES: beta-ketoacyl-ACP synthase III [Pelosinus]EIW20606.1 3-oxoacyl-(acyl-carrier-protein) synthase III [Pelosinus fermentans B4]EIW25679.1 3-oxoacyl-(acyl-carrier-protein) synthase 3 [Pelosinus fermentans A11]OAM93402.1 3-oxoacyl-(acyl-carrier-protein) synthase 3 [Pelosinus fermentans DSM 17108]SDQ76536.1 3-oxoacyl-[acyl-carrier-protein] synthase-3 [Pelosinus fermentans]